MSNTGVVHSASAAIRHDYSRITAGVPSDKIASPILVVISNGHNLYRERSDCRSAAERSRYYFMHLIDWDDHQDQWLHLHANLSTYATGIRFVYRLIE